MKNTFRKQILFCLLFIGSIHIFGQTNGGNDSFVFYKSEAIYRQSVDSVKIGLYLYSDKEYSEVSLFDEKTEKEDTFELIGDAALTEKEIEGLNNYINSSQSFCHDRALLNHVDVEIKYYKNNKVVQRILMSSLTRNFVMFDKNDEVIVRNCINKKFHHFIAKILKRRGLWNDELEFNFYENY